MIPVPGWGAGHGRHRRWLCRRHLQRPGDDVAFRLGASSTRPGAGRLLCRLSRCVSTGSRCTRAGADREDPHQQLLPSFNLVEKSQSRRKKFHALFTNGYWFPPNIHVSPSPAPHTAASR